MDPFNFARGNCPSGLAGLVEQRDTSSQWLVEPFDTRLCAQRPWQQFFTGGACTEKDDCVFRRVSHPIEVLEDSNHPIF